MTVRELIVSFLAQDLDEPVCIQKIRRGQGKEIIGSWTTPAVRVGASGCIEIDAATEWIGGEG